MEGFKYVVNPPEPQKVGFGRCVDCDYYIFDPTVRSNRSYPGPSDHNAHQIWGKKGLSNKGYNAFASKTSRDFTIYKSNTWNFGIYDPYKSKPIKQSYVPFGSSAVAISPPGRPDTYCYPYHMQIKKPKINSSFGKKREIYPEVAVICSPYNESKCWKCKKMPIGDYWHNWTNKLDMCRQCRNKIIVGISPCEVDKYFRGQAFKELAQFSPVRHCSFFHDHGGTKAATKLMGLRQLRLKIKVENYLHLYPQSNKLINVNIKKSKKITNKIVVKHKNIPKSPTKPARPVFPKLSSIYAL